MSAVAIIGPKFYAWDANGNPLAFGKVYTYQARTNNPKDTFMSEDMVTPNTNPVILNGEGYANIYLDGSYKIVVKDANENERWTSDPVSASQPTEWVNCATPTFISSTVVTVPGDFTAAYEEGRRVRIDNNVSTFAYSQVVSSSFAASVTTITLLDPVVTTGVLEICASIVGVESLGERNDIVFKNVTDMAAATTINGKTVTFAEGQLLTTRDRLNLGDNGGANWLVRTGQTPNTYTKIDLGNSLTAVIEPINGEVTAESCGCVGTGDVTLACQEWADFTADERLKGVTNGIATINITGITVKSNANLDIGNTELFLINGSNNQIIKNANESFSTITDKNITIKGIKDLNCNEANQNNVDETGTVLSGVRFTGVENLTFDIPVFAAARYAIWCINVDGFYSEIIRTKATHVNAYPNTDGLHLNGNCRNFYIGDVIIIDNEDDGLAINADDVDHGGNFSAVNVSGPITNINIRSLFVDGFQAVRLLAAVNNIEDCHIETVSGSIARHAVLAEPFGLGSGGLYRKVRFDRIACDFVDKTGVTTGQKFVWLDTVGGGLSDFSFGDINRTQVGVAANSVGANTLAILANNVNVTVENVREYGCGNAEGLAVVATGSVNVVDVNTWTRLASAVTGVVCASISGTGTLERIAVEAIVTDGYTNLFKVTQAVTVVHMSIMDSPATVSGTPLTIDTGTVVRLVSNNIVPVNSQIYVLSNGGSITNVSQIEVNQTTAGDSRQADPTTNMFLYDNNLGIFVLYNGTQYVKLTPVNE